MVFKQYLILFLLAHVLGDYYFQSGAMAQDKHSRFSACAKHLLLYAAACLIVFVPVFSFQLLCAAAALMLCHAAIDTVKYLIVRRRPGLSGRTVYIADQAAHLATLAGAALYFAAFGRGVEPLPAAAGLLSLADIPFEAALAWLLLLLLIWKPANITIRRLLSIHKPESAGDAPGYANTGAFIGLIERLIILVLIPIGQFSAIGLVLTAKSIARYNRISEDRGFAEYYLLGTLLSTAFVIASWLLIF